MNSPRQARIAIALFFFLSGFGFSSWASRIPDLQHRLQLNNAELGIVLFALPVGLFCTMPVTGILLQRFSSSRIMFIGALAFNGMLSLLGFVTSVWQLVIGLLCFGASRNMLNISMNAQSVGVQALYQRSIITTFHGIWSVAGFCGAGLGGIMVYFKIAPQWHFMIVGVLMVILGFFAYPGSLKQPPATSGRGKFAWPDKGLMKYGLICFAVMSCEGTMIDWCAIYFKEAVQASEKIVTAGFVVYMGAMAAARFTGDKLLHKLGIVTMIKYSGLLIFCGLSLAALVPHPIPAGIGFMMTGVGVSCVVPLVFSMAGKSTTMANGPAIAAVSTIGYIGFLLVPPMIGFMSEAVGLRWTFALMALFGLLITALITISSSSKFSASQKTPLPQSPAHHPAEDHPVPNLQ
ncbi:MFS transporter [Chitinophaga sp. SYP-B3965]|uniref:MFS transporter n=1 Tax=Chitinophaga sp. SYP-B3965 TaxID=2663120 RepID=UPI001299AF27|nr:MFS transporter [Chitinophaga sp. SYP-B3965]MRG44758.1 MFS transporter [Chitinophaga sp. SYP-B3965]